MNLKDRRILDMDVGDGDERICSLGTQEHEFPGECGTRRDDV